MTIRMSMLAALLIASPAIAQPRWTVPTQPLGYPLIPMPDAAPTPPPPVIAPARPGLPPTLPLGYPLIPMPAPTHSWGR